MVTCARGFLEKLDLADFTRGAFAEVLDVKTNELRAAFLTKLPADAECWGLARKVLNLYLRDAYYNRFLCEHYRLNEIAAELETPLDGDADKVLRRYFWANQRRALPTWPRLKGEKEDYQAHRDAAKEFAEYHCGEFYPVHADLLLYNAVDREDAQG